ncbi:Nuclear shuttle [Gossypium arboreum]|uniref:Nuclear shuttle n=1 Tax=Gossypium arboreum TaxID=29729 RepID=A0A0B0PGS0_GOSAR|nr:Nuclear shuttle [Gossypium arboreum]
MERNKVSIKLSKLHENKYNDNFTIHHHAHNTKIGISTTYSSLSKTIHIAYTKLTSHAFHLGTCITHNMVILFSFNLNYNSHR